jgi:hypothetical protein
MTHRTHSKAAIEGQRRANWNQSAEDAPWVNSITI